MNKLHYATLLSSNDLLMSQCC